MQIRLLKIDSVASRLGDNSTENVVTSSRSPRVVRGVRLIFLHSVIPLPNKGLVYRAAI